MGESYLAQYNLLVLLQLMVQDTLDLQHVQVGANTPHPWLHGLNV